MKKIFCLIYCLSFFTFGFAQKQKVWLDADTGNEMDDLYAIVRLVKEPSIELVGLSSAHFNNPDLLVFEKWNAYDTKGLNTVAESQRLNEQILKALGKLEILHPLGADRQIGRAWGQEDARDSKAAQAIITAVKSLPENEKLDILTIGAMTNVSSALILAPEIKSKIRCFSLGAQYNPKTKVWNKNEFNIRNDLNAFDYLLDQPDLDLVIMPVNVARPFKFERDLLYRILDEHVPAERMMRERWRETNPDDKERTLWDLALVAAFFHPEDATLESASTPPENTPRPVRVYRSINVPALTAQFLRQLHFQAGLKR